MKKKNNNDFMEDMESLAMFESINKAAEKEQERRRETRKKRKLKKAIEKYLTIILMVCCILVFYYIVIYNSFNVECSKEFIIVNIIVIIDIILIGKYAE